MVVIDERLGELGKDTLDGRVICGHGAPLAQAAGSAGKNDIVDRALAATRRGSDVVEVEDPAVAIEELKKSAWREAGAHGPQSTVLADAAVAGGDFVSYSCRDVSAIAHATSLATGSAESPARDAARDALRPTVVELKASAVALVERMCAVGRDG